MSKAEEFNKKFAEYKQIVSEGKVPDVLFTSQLLLLANDVVSDAEDVGGRKGEVDFETMIEQLGKDTGGLLGEVNVHRAQANREAFLERYQEALEAEAKAKKNAAEVLAGTVIGLAISAAKLSM